ncbi:C39 family peptidase [Mycolicibacterium llatzerense]|uniref:C39 family peptidase n=1 Tax=Mycolicibacterium llatzerense TaxID=280871 RepID=UPI0008DDE475|nr:C39 family peptidase [Mycolicibacterium llatzerense]
MTEKKLQFDPDVVPQQEKWDCGPASCQVVLNSRGIIRTEQDLIAQIGTTVNGTDYVGLIERVLDVIVPDARYTSVYLEHYPATDQQKNDLWNNVVQSIDGGYGVVMNWDAPEDNYPIGVKNTQSPSYHGGEVLHYVACMGYDDDPAARALFIADPGFPPNRYWITFDQAVKLIPPKGYAYADTGVKQAAPIAPPDQAADTLTRAMGGSVPFDRYRELLPSVTQALQQSQCNTDLLTELPCRPFRRCVRGSTGLARFVSHDQRQGRAARVVRTGGPGAGVARGDGRSVRAVSTR